jgi:hypothetical protein
LIVSSDASEQIANRAFKMIYFLAILFLILMLYVIDATFFNCLRCLKYICCGKKEVLIEKEEVPNNEKNVHLDKFKFKENF